MTTLNDIASKAAKRIDSGNDPIDVYCIENLPAALDVARHDGTLYDLDCMVALGDVLGSPASWELYHFLNGRYPFDLLALCENPDEARGELKPMLADYIAGTEA